MPLRFVDDVYVYFQDEIKYFRVFLKTSVLYSPRRTGPLPWCRSYPRPLTLLLCIRINTTNTDSPTVHRYQYYWHLLSYCAGVILHLSSQLENSSPQPLNNFYTLQIIRLVSNTGSSRSEHNQLLKYFIIFDTIYYIWYITLIGSFTSTPWRKVKYISLQIKWDSNWAA